MSNRMSWGGAVALVLLVVAVVALVAVPMLHPASPGASLQATAPAVATTAPARQPEAALISYAVLGDFGICRSTDSDSGYPAHPGQYCETQRRVRDLVARMAPTGGVLTVGDNTYPDARTSGYDVDNRQFYEPLVGSRFFPTLGNHDWNVPGSGAATYLGFFNGWVNLAQYTTTLAPRTGRNEAGANNGSNGRYYQFQDGQGAAAAPLVHFFALDSDFGEEFKDGRDTDSRQYEWVAHEAAQSRACFKIAYFHHPPYTSGATHPPTEAMRWDYGDLGVDLVLAGHAHQFEALELDGVMYLINGLGGATNLHAFRPPDGARCTARDPHSLLRYPDVATCDDAPPPELFGSAADDRGAIELRISVSPSSVGHLSAALQVVDTTLGVPPAPRQVAAVGLAKQCGGRPSGSAAPSGQWQRFGSAADVQSFHAG